MIQNYRGDSEKVIVVEELECSHNCCYKYIVIMCVENQIYYSRKLRSEV